MPKAAIVGKERIRKAIYGSNGVISEVARRAKCTRAVVHKMLAKPENNDLKALLLEEREKIVDVAENKLYKKVNEEDWNAIKFTLQTIGARRGFQERHQVEHFGASSIEVTFDDPVKNKVIDVTPEKEEIEEGK